MLSMACLKLDTVVVFEQPTNELTTSHGAPKVGAFAGQRNLQPLTDRWLVGFLAVNQRKRYGLAKDPV